MCRLRQRRRLRLSGKTEILEEEDRIDRERVVELDDIDVARPEPGIA